MLDGGTEWQDGPGRAKPALAEHLSQAETRAGECPVCAKPGAWGPR